MVVKGVKLNRYIVFLSEGLVIFSFDAHYAIGVRFHTLKGDVYILIVIEYPYKCLFFGRLFDSIAVKSVATFACDQQSSSSFPSITGGVSVRTASIERAGPLSFAVPVFVSSAIAGRAISSTAACLPNVVFISSAPPNYEQGFSILTFSCITKSKKLNFT